MGTVSLAVQLFIVFLLTSYLLNKVSFASLRYIIPNLSRSVFNYSQTEPNSHCFDFYRMVLLTDHSFRSPSRCGDCKFLLGVPFHSPILQTFFHKCETDRQRILNASSTPAPDFPACELPGGYVPDNVLFDLWRVVYWSAQLLTWLILPLLQSYVTAGNFTVLGKVRAAVISNALYYGIYSLCFLAILIYAMFKRVSLNM